MKLNVSPRSNVIGGMIYLIIYLATGGGVAGAIIGAVILAVIVFLIAFGLQPADRTAASLSRRFDRAQDCDAWRSSRRPSSLAVGLSMLAICVVRRAWSLGTRPHG